MKTQALMFNYRKKLKWSALIAGAALIAGTALAQDNNKALLDLLVKKGVITTDEADQLQAEVAKTATAAKPSAVKTTVSGKMYIDVSNITAETANGTKVNPSGTGIDVKRFYFGVTHQFNDMWLANINTDSAFSSSTGTVTPFIKTAYVQAKFSPEAILQVGSANEPWIPFVEDLYGFRYVENTLTDREHVANSADWGVHLLGSNGLISYNVAAVNGGGYKNPTRSKTVDFEGRFSAEPMKGLVFAIGGYTGKQGKETYGLPAGTTLRTTDRIDGLISYSTSLFHIGGEYYSENNWGDTISPAKSDKGDGYSIWGAIKIADPFTAFVRYDSVKPSKLQHPNEKEWYGNIGLEYTAIKGVNIALVYKHDHIDNPPSASTVTKYDEIGIFSQVAF